MRGGLNRDLSRVDQDEGRLFDELTADRDSGRLDEPDWDELTDDLAARASEQRRRLRDGRSYEPLTKVR